MRRVTAFLLAGLLTAGLTLTAEAQVFDDDALPVVEITLDPDDWARIMAPGNEWSDTEYAATFRWTSPTLTAVVDSVGFRLRGNTSRNSQKKSYKVSFNSFRKGAKWEGLEKMNLNGEHNDPSIMRSKLAWDLFREAGVPASRANHVALYVNGEYRGLYINVEHVDEEFIERYFGNPGDPSWGVANGGGNLYKSLWPADLTVLGSDGSAYRPSGDGDRRPYDLTQGASDEDGYEDIAHLIGVINNTSNSQFKSALEAVFDVDGFLRVQALTVLTGSWDSYWFLKNNFYLYNNPGTGKWHYVPFDFDNTFGIWWSGIATGLDFRTRNVYEWGHPNEPRPLMRRMLEVPEFRERYTWHLRDLLETVFDPAAIESEVARLKAMTERAAEDDTFRTRDYGFTEADYHASFTGALNGPNQGHVTAGLLPFVSQRYSSALAQLDPAPIAPFVSDVQVLPERPLPDDTLRVSATITTASLALAQVEFWPEVPQGQLAQMWEVSRDRFEARVPPLGKSGTMDLRVFAADGQGNERRSSLLRIGVGLRKPAVFINELVALNDASLADDFGEFDDWAEIYNGSGATVDLTGWQLTDEDAGPSRFSFPEATSIGPGKYVIVWLDGQPEQGGLHASFRLSGSGEELVLREPDGQEVDYVSFGSLEVDVAWGRVTDGARDFAMLSPSPAMPNSLSSDVEDEPLGSLPAVEVFPNPFSSAVEIRGGAFEVFDVLGRRAYAAAEPGRWDAGQMPPGIYMVRIGTVIRSIVKVQ